MNKLSIKWKIFSYLFVFVIILLILLWLFQIVFLDSFYKTIKTRNIKSVAEEVGKNIGSKTMEETLDKLSKENDINIRLINDNGENTYSSEVRPDSLIHKMNLVQISDLYKEALKNGGSTFKTYYVGSREKYFENKNNIDPPPGKQMKSMVYLKIINKYNKQYTIMTNAAITPINATVETLRVQLVYISGILILLSIILALIIAKNISKPIVKINNSAKELAKGDYNTEFNGKGYLEIEELNDTLNYTASELSKVEALRHELISNISHDLRTPLTMITGYAEVMRDIPGENTPENVQIIIDEAKHLSTLVNDILDISKIQSGTQEINLERFNVTESIREILKRYSKLIENDGYTIEFKYDVDIFIKADEVRISQVIYNLVNNAITYTGEDKKITLVQTIENNWVKIEVIDTGEGVSSDMLPYVWDRYYKSKKTHKRSSVGTGLGLSIVKGIIDMHKGEYGVISSEGYGSNFWFKLKTD